MELKLINMKGEATGTLAVNDTLFAREYNEALIHQVVTAYLANARGGNRAQKTRAQVAKSTRKPFKQKGTGRARAGMASSPIWRGGGRAFPNTPNENFTQKVNRKMYRAAIASILSKLVVDEKLIAIDNIAVATHKTKDFVDILKNMSLNNNTVLIVVDELSDELFLASRNLYKVLILESHQIDPYNLLRCDKIVLSQKAIEMLQEKWA